jgi:hypothetical protein
MNRFGPSFRRLTGGEKHERAGVVGLFDLWQPFKIEFDV